MTNWTKIEDKLDEQFHEALRKFEEKKKATQTKDRCSTIRNQKKRD